MTPEEFVRDMENSYVPLEMAAVIAEKLKKVCCWGTGIDECCRDGADHQ